MPPRPPSWIWGMGQREDREGRDRGKAGIWMVRDKGWVGQGKGRCGGKGGMNVERGRGRDRERHDPLSNSPMLTGRVGTWSTVVQCWSRGRVVELYGCPASPSLHITSTVAVALRDIELISDTVD